MFETFKLLNRFYREETKGLNLLHKFCTYGFYFVHEGFKLILPKSFRPDFFNYYFRIGFIPLKIVLKDGIIIHHLANHYSVFFEILLDDDYELKKLTKEDVVVDVGANIGIVSLIASKRYHVKKVICFEPNNNNYLFLKKNISENKCKNVEIVKSAVSSTTGIAKLFIRSSGTHTLREEKGGKYYENVRKDTLDNLVHEKQIDFLKIDVEGSELEVLKGAKKTLKNTKKIIMERSLNNKFYAKEEPIKILEKNKFKLRFEEGSLMLYAEKA